MENSYWWSDAGCFRPGEGILPHMGEVIAEYRLRRGWNTQADLAVAAGVSLRAVTDWESKAMVTDFARRIFLARLLKIPPALLGIDWRTVFYEDNTGKHAEPLTQDERWLEDSYYHYEDTLALTWNLSFSGRYAQIANRFERRLFKLDQIARNIAGPEKEAWLSLLSQYYQASIQTPEHLGKSETSRFMALQRCQTAIQIAEEIEDPELLAGGCFRLAGLHENYNELELARESILRGMNYVEQVRDSTRGNLYLRVADISSQFAQNDTKLITDIRNWQEKALNIVSKGELEPDRGCIRLNSAAVHHERAKTLLRFSLMQPAEKTLLEDARAEMQQAQEALTPDLAIWQMYFLATEARLYLAGNDLEGSSKLGLNALQAARTVQSKKGERQVRQLFLELRQRDRNNPYVCNLGVELGLF